MTQRMIKRWHQTLESRILMENCYLPGDLEVQATPGGLHLHTSMMHGLASVHGNKLPAQPYVNG